MTTPRDAAKQLILDCIAHKQPLRTGVRSDYNGHHVQIGGQVSHEGRVRTYDRHFVLVVEPGGAVHPLNLHVLLYELNAHSRPAMTPREAAKKLVTYSVTRGVAKGHSINKITNDLQELQLGHYWIDYWAAIGSGNRGTCNGKRRGTRPGDILVKDVSSVPINVIFDLREIVAEVYAELTRGAQLSLWQTAVEAK